MWPGVIVGVSTCASASPSAEPPGAPPACTITACFAFQSFAVARTTFAKLCFGTFTMSSRILPHSAFAVRGPSLGDSRVSSARVCSARYCSIRSERCSFRASLLALRKLSRALKLLTVSLRSNESSHRMSRTLYIMVTMYVT